MAAPLKKHAWERTVISWVVWYCSMSWLMYNKPFSSHHIDLVVFLYHSFLFSICVRCNCSVRAVRVICISQIWHPTFKPPMTLVHLLKQYTQISILPLHSVISAGFSLSQPRKQINAHTGVAILDMVCRCHISKMGDMSLHTYVPKDGEHNIFVLHLPATGLTHFRAKLPLFFFLWLTFVL